MNKNKKNKLLYNLIVSLTLVLPTSITLFISAIWSSPKPDLVVMFETTNEIKKVEELKEYFLFAPSENNTDIVIKVANEDVKKLGVYNIDFSNYKKVELIDNEINAITIKKDYYVQFKVDKFNKVVEFTKENNAIVPIQVSNINKETGNKLSIAFVSSAVAILVVVLIITKKMMFHKKYPRLATFIALLLGTVILGVINAIIGSMFTVFIVATISWGAYCIEYTYYTNKNKNEISEKKTSSLLSELERTLNDYK